MPPEHRWSQQSVHRASSSDQWCACGCRRAARPQFFSQGSRHPQAARRAGGTGRDHEHCMAVPATCVVVVVRKGCSHPCLAARAGCRRSRGPREDKQVLTAAERRRCCQRWLAGEALLCPRPHAALYRQSCGAAHRRIAVGVTDILQSCSAQLDVPRGINHRRPNNPGCSRRGGQAASPAPSASTIRAKLR